jgi:hypothetical protein
MPVANGCFVFASKRCHSKKQSAGTRQRRYLIASLKAGRSGDGLCLCVYRAESNLGVLRPVGILLEKSYGSANPPKCPEQRFASDRQFDLDQWRISELVCDTPAFGSGAKWERPSCAKSPPGCRNLGGCRDFDRQFGSAPSLTQDLLNRKPLQFNYMGVFAVSSDSGIAHALNML